MELPVGNTYNQFRGCTALKKIEVSKDNIALMAENNVLYSKDGKTLIQYPAGSTAKIFKIPEGVTKIAEFSMGYSKLTGIEFPSTLTNIGVNAFECTNNLLYIKNNSKESFDLSKLVYSQLYDGGDQKTKKINAKQTLFTKKKTVSLDNSTYVYNGTSRTPKLTVKNGAGTTLVEGVDYTVSYPSQRKNVGKYSVKVSFAGDYSGSKTLSFTIKPSSTALKKVTSGSKRFTAKWTKKSRQTTGYQIQYSTSSSFKNAKTVTVSSNKTTSKIIKNLKAKKTYYVRIRTYKTVGKTKYYSTWSSKKTVTTKK